MLTLLLVVTVLIYQRCFRRFDAEGYGRFGCPAEFLTFRSGEQKLQGYLFGRGDTLVVLAPGLGNGAFSYAAQIRWLVMAGRRVFAFDYTGCYGSEGRSCRGFPQAAGDLKAALDFVESKGRFGSTRLCLLGHSMGGYAVCNAMPDYRVDAAVCVGGVNSAMEATISPVIAKVGPLAYLHYPFLWAYQALRFGVRALRQSAARAAEAAGRPLLLVNGVNDWIAPLHRSSIVSHLGQIHGAQCLLWAEPGRDGHADLLFGDSRDEANVPLMEAIDHFFSEPLPGAQS